MGLLHEAGLAEVYRRDVQGLNTLLMALGQRGLPIDQEKRVHVAAELSQERHTLLAEMQELVPPAAKKAKIWKKRKKAWGETLPARIRVELIEVTKKATKKQPERTVLVEHYLEVLPFVPSNQQLKAYAKIKGYRLSSKTDRFTGKIRETADEATLRRLALRHEQDRLFPLILKYREIDKWISTYVGRPEA